VTKGKEYKHREITLKFFNDSYDDWNRKLET
jgi:hypothetical protein